VSTFVSQNNFGTITPLPHSHLAECGRSRSVDMSVITDSPENFDPRVPHVSRSLEVINCNRDGLIDYL